MPDFYEELTRELRGWHDETNWLTPDDVAEMLAAAAGRVAGDIEHEIKVLPVLFGGQVQHVIDAGVTHYKMCLGADEVAVLRALLLAYDETAPRPEDARTYVYLMEGGEPVTTWEV
jgi:hypothetical protein